MIAWSAFVWPNATVNIHHCIELSLIVFLGVFFHFSPWNILNYKKHVFIECRIIFLLCQLFDTPSVLIKDSDVIHIDNKQTVIDLTSLSQ